jgi:hypothetical protein
MHPAICTEHTAACEATQVLRAMPPVISSSIAEAASVFDPEAPTLGAGFGNMPSGHARHLHKNLTLEPHPSSAAELGFLLLEKV